jgi:6-phosphogluconolactonase (cycloisomerase 2 family)
VTVADSVTPGSRARAAARTVSPMRSPVVVPALALLALAACGGSETSPTTAGSAVPPIPVQRFLSASRDVIETFTVDPADGRLVPAARLTNVSPSISVVVTPSGERLYAATTNGIEGFRVDPGGAGLTPLPGSPYPGTTRLAVLALDPSGTVLHAQRQGEILSLRADASGRLAAFSATAAPQFLTGIAVEPSGHYAYGLAGPALAGFRIDASGALEALPGSPYPLLASGVNPSGLRIARVGPYLYFSSQGDGVRPANLQVYRFDGGTGIPEPVAQYTTPGDAVPSGFEASRSGAILYVGYRNVSSLNPAPNFVQAYAVDGATGRLAALARLDVGRGIFSKLKLSADERALFMTLEPASAEPPVPPTMVAAISLSPAGEPVALAGSLQPVTSFAHSLLAFASPGR